MLAQYQSEVAGLDYAYAESQGLTAYDVLKLASIVERESDHEHFPTVASVFYNRLASDRPYLESDATTAYEVGRTPTADEVHADTPYSTYANPGLPPTPICAPEHRGACRRCVRPSRRTTLLLHEAARRRQAPSTISV